MAVLIAEDLGIPSRCLRCQNEYWYSAVVHKNWLSCVRQKLPLQQNLGYDSLTECDIELILAPSNSHVSDPWQRVIINSIPKIDCQVQSLVEEPLCEDFDEDGIADVFNTASQMIWAGHHDSARSKFKHAIQVTNRHVSSEITMENFQCVVANTLSKLYKCQIQDLETPNGQPDTSKSLFGSKHCGLSPVYGIFESQSAFYVVHPFVQYTLWDLVAFSPAKIADHHTRIHFIVHQILQCIRYCHVQGISVGDLTLRDFAVDESLWIYILPPKVERIVHHLSGDTDHSDKSTDPNASANLAQASRNSKNASIENLPSLVQDWVECRISNYDYLMSLNTIAGRRYGDPNHHPVLPWTTNFSSRTGALRDLTKSKYRLNKGDRQLDLTYDTTDKEAMLDDLSIPHHVSDFLSDITYYVYKARQTPKEVLCKHVRSRWVPNEYPNSIQRLQEWTPDECIPEFYDNPDIFKSIHRDLEDLELPAWADSVDDFLGIHRGVLESAEVSSELHHWIDLTFGYKLSGMAAVKAKNVCLQLVNKHTDLVNHGMTQLFNRPHPSRLSYIPIPSEPSLKYSEKPAKVSSKPGVDLKRNPSSASLKDHKEDIRLVNGYDPVLALDSLERLFDFSLSTAEHLPPHSKTKDRAELPLSSRLVQRDMQALGCLIVEFVLSPRVRGIGCDASLSSRFLLARKVALKHLNEIPRSLQHGVRVLLNLDKPYEEPAKDHGFHPLFVYPNVSLDGLAPPNVSYLLHPASGIEFPPYRSKLYHVISQTQGFYRNISEIDATELNVVDRILKTKRLGKDIVAKWELFLIHHSAMLNTSALEIALPFIYSIFDNPVTGAQAAWSLFQPLSRIFGSTLSKKYLLPRLTELFSNEATTPKYLKLYHRTYAIQLIVRLGLKTFLDNFSTLLVEATAGYKNFSEDEYIERQISIESDKVQNIFGSSHKPELGRSASLEVVEGVKGALDADDVFETDLLFDDIGNQAAYVGSGYRDEPNVSYAEDALGYDVDSASLNGEEEDDEDDITEGEGEELGKSVGRLSVHSVSRLMENDHHSGSSEHTNGSSTDEDNSSNCRLDSDSGNGNCCLDTVSGPSLASAADNAVPTCKLTPLMMVRSDTAEFGGATHDTSGNSVEYNIGEVSSETIKWLAHRLGPVLTAKYLSRNLLRMLALCYQGSDQQQYITTDGDGEVSSRGLTRCPVLGDMRASQVLDSLIFISTMFGEQLILLQYFPHAKELISSAGTKLSQRTEGGLLSCTKLILHMIPYISDSVLMDLLQDTLFSAMILPLIKIVSSQHVHFPGSSHARGLLCNKILDVLYVISLRIGFEMTRQHMTFVLQKFFAAFSRVYTEPREGRTGTDAEVQQDGTDRHSESDMYFAVRLDQSSNEFGVDDTEQYSHTAVSPGRHHDRRANKTHSLNYQAGNDDKFENRSPNSPSQEEVLSELRQTFTAELAHTAYIMFCKLAGGIHMEQSLMNDDLIRWLCSEHDQAMNQQRNAASTTLLSDESTESLVSNEDPVSPVEDVSVVSGSFGRNVSVAGNKIVIQDEEKDVMHQETVPKQSSSHRKSAEQSIDPSKLRSNEMTLNQQRHLRGNWLAYWEHEVGLADSASNFNFKQIKLQTCSGHTNSVRSIVCLDNENSFLSASKDKTVKLWSLRNIGDGGARIGCQWTYTKHRRSVFGINFLEHSRLVASCDGNVHVWDPFVGMCIVQLESTKSSVVTSLTCLPEPANTLVTVSSDSIVRFLDARTGSFCHEFRCSTTPAGHIRCISVSDDGRWLVVGYSTGMLSTLDVRTGLLLSSWKGHEGEILQVKTFNDKQFVTSSIDQTMCLWNAADGKLASSLKGLTEPVHCLNTYKDGVIWGSTGNRVGVHTSIGTQRSSRSSSKLRNEVFKGVLTNLEVLPLNHLLLLGSDSGQISVLA